MGKALSRHKMLFIIIALACAARLAGLGKSFQGDEFFSLMDARSFFAIPSALIGDTHPPLYFYLLHFWMKLSMSEPFLRLLSVIPGVGLVYVVFLLGERSFGLVYGVVSAVIVAAAPIAVWSSQYIRTYSLAAFFMALSVFFMTDIISGRRSGRGGWALYILFSAASIYTFYFSALVIIGQNVFAILCMRSDKAFLRRWFVSQAAVLMLYLPWIPFFLYQRTSYVAHPQMVEMAGFYIRGIHIGALVRSFMGLAGLDPRFLLTTTVSGRPALIAGLILSVAAGGVAAAWLAWKYFRYRFFQKDEQKMLSLFLALAIVPFVIALILHQTFKIILMSHYFIASFSFMAIFLAAMCVRTVPSRLAVVILACLILVYVARLGVLYQDRGMDFKDARRYVKSMIGTNETVISPAFGGMFDYYFFDFTQRRHMEDPRAPFFAGRSVVVISYPGKLELKECYKRFMTHLSQRGFVRATSYSSGDLSIERYAL